MTPVAKAAYYPADERFPVCIELPMDWAKMSIDEAIQLVGELLDAINEAQAKERKCA